MRLQSAPAIRIPGHRLPFQPSRNASNDPRIHAARSRPGVQHRYALAIVATDFIATSETFHRSLIRIAMGSAGRIGLLQQPVGGMGSAAVLDSRCDEILLEGLRRRLGLDENTCAIVTDPRALPVHGDILIVHGRVASALPSGLHPMADMSGMRSDLVIVQDGPDWDCEHWGDATT